MAAALSGLPPRTRGLVVAGILAALSLPLFAIRLAPFGVVALVLAGGAAARAVRQDKSPLGDEGAPKLGAMTEAEALSVLGLSKGADPPAIDAAHKRMIVRAHPDRGGSDYLAAKVNEARDVLRR